MSFFQALKSKVSELGIFDQNNNERKPTRDELFRKEFRLPSSQDIQIESGAEVTLIHLDNSDSGNQGAKQSVNQQSYANPSSMTTPSPVTSPQFQSHHGHNNDEYEFYYSGRLFLTNQYLVFKDNFNERDFNFVIHISAIRRVERLPSANYVFGLILTTSAGLKLKVQFIGIRSNSESFSLLLKKSLDLNMSKVKQLKPFLKTLHSEYLIAKNTPGQHNPDLQVPNGGLGLIFKYPGNAKKLRDKSKMRLWYDFMKTNGRNLNIIKQEMFYKLTRVGLPNRLRGELWELNSGSLYLRYENIGIYENILKANEGKTSIAIEEIEKDLNRSLPEYAAYQDEEGITRLRRVLTAYSWRNPEVGYCQAMNIVVAQLLIYMSEEQAFWCLCQLCDQFVPGYYSKTMYGTLLDQKVFEALVEKTMPILWEHITQKDIQLSIVSLPWFLSLFINSMPLVYSARIVDILFMQGSRTLFQVALAILKVNGDKLLNTDDDGTFIQIIKDYFNTLDDSAHPNSKNEHYRTITNFQELLVVAFKEFQDISNDTVQNYRRKHKNAVYQNIQTFIKRTEIRNLPKFNNLNNDCISNIYDRYYQILDTNNIETGANISNGTNGNSNGTSSTLMNYFQFERFLNDVTNFVLIPNLVDEKNQREFLGRLFKSWDGENKGGLTLEDLCRGLNKWISVDLMLLIKNFFDLYDNNALGYIGKEEILSMSEGIIFLTRPLREGWIFDSVTNKEIENVQKKRKEEYERQIKEENERILRSGDDSAESTIIPPNLAIDVDYYKHKQAERYLSAASQFLQNCFNYARPESEVKSEKENPLIDLDTRDEKKEEMNKTSVTLNSNVDTLVDDLANEEYIDEKDRKKSDILKANKALDPTHPLALDLPTFRMVILADETYELYFAQIMSTLFDVLKPLRNDKSVFNLRNIFDSLVADGRKVATEVKKRMDSNTSGASVKSSNSGASSSQSANIADDEDEDDFSTSEKPIDTNFLNDGI